MFTLNCKGRLLVAHQPLVMGIINVTPDSFYSGSRKTAINEILRQSEKMLDEGAAILDIGGQSTRPGSSEQETSEELQRVVPAIEAVNKNFPEAYISVDTYRSAVAREAVEAGACIVNDISGGSIDDAMQAIVASLKVPFVCMHMKGTPLTMQSEANYDNVTREVLDYLVQKVEMCRLAGIRDVIVDPGFGFAKTIQHNFELLKNLEVFKILNRPLLLGISRKATIYKTLGITAAEALNGTTVLNTIGLLKGAAILRVHDVREAVEAVKLISQMPSIGMSDFAIGEFRN